MKYLKQQRGVSLVEVIAAILLIFLILLSFLTFFIQTKKTNIQSETIQDATYTAQITMENIYALSQKIPIEHINEHSLNALSYVATSVESNSCTDVVTKDTPNEFKNTYTYEKDGPPFLTKVSISSLCDYTNAGHVLVEIFDLNHVKKAVFENTYIWNE